MPRLLHAQLALVVAVQLGCVDRWTVSRVDDLGPDSSDERERDGASTADEDADATDIELPTDSGAAVDVDAQSADMDAGLTEFSLLESDPAADGELAALDAPVTLRFSADIERSSVSADSVRIMRAGQVVSGDVAVVDRRTITFTPRQPWPLGGAYVLEVSDLRAADERVISPLTVAFSAPEGTWQFTRQYDAVPYPVSLSVSPGGLAALAWSVTGQIQGSVNLWAQRYDGSNWTTPELMASGGMQSQWPSISVNDAARAILTWRTIDYDPAAYYRIFDGATWSAQTSAGFSDQPSALISASGSAYVGRDNKVARTVQVTSVDVARPNSAYTSTLSPVDAGVSVTPPDMALVDNDVLLAWGQQASTGERTLWLRPGQNTFGREAVQVSEPGGSATGVSVAAERVTDTAMVVYQQVDEDFTNIHAVRIQSDGALVARAVLSNRAGAASSANVAVDDTGGALAAWVQRIGASDQIFAAHFTPSGGWTASEVVSDPALGNAAGPQVSLEAFGNGFVVWRQLSTDGMARGVYTARYVAGVGFVKGRRRKLSDATVADRSPAVGVDATGRVFVAWIEASGIWVGRFE